MTAHRLPPAVRRSLRIAFALIVVLLVAPLVGIGLERLLGLSNALVNAGLMAIHGLGLLAMLGWAVLFRPVEPMLARIGLVVTFLLIVLWAFFLLARG